jgi:hypothetical protein
MNNGFECPIRLLPGDTSWEKYYSAIEMVMLFQDCLYNLRQFDSLKDPYSNYSQFISVAGQ